MEAVLPQVFNFRKLYRNEKPPWKPNATSKNFSVLMSRHATIAKRIKNTQGGGFLVEFSPAPQIGMQAPRGGLRLAL